METPRYGPSGLKSNTPTSEPAYDAERLKAEPAYRYGKVDEFTAYLNSIPDYADRVRYYLDMTVAMGEEIPEFHTGLSVNISEERKQLIAIETEDGWEPKSAGKHSRIQKPRNLTLISPTKEWALIPVNNKDRAIVCKEWFERVRHSRFTHLLFNERNEYREWHNETINERKARFEQQVIGRERAAYAKTKLADIQHEMVQFLQDFEAIQRKRDLILTQKHNLENIQNIKAREQQRYKPKSDPLKTNQPFDLIRKELDKEKGIIWSAFIQGRELECFGILWGMVEYCQWLEAGAISVVSAQTI